VGEVASRRYRRRIRVLHLCDEPAAFARAADYDVDDSLTVPERTLELAGGELAGMPPNAAGPHAFRTGRVVTVHVDDEGRFRQTVDVALDAPRAGRLGVRREEVDGPVQQSVIDDEYLVLSHGRFEQALSTRQLEEPEADLHSAERSDRSHHLSADNDRAEPRMLRRERERVN
jgi:hypothetical protein